MSGERALPLAVGFLGAGQMATALALGWAKAGLLDVGKSRASDPYPDARAKFEKATGVEALDANREVAAPCDVLVLAVKPQVMPAVLTELKPAVSPRHLVVSIATGVTLRTLADALGEKTRLVRVMPNTPCLVGASASAFAPGLAATADDAELGGNLFGP